MVGTFPAGSNAWVGNPLRCWLAGKSLLAAAGRIERQILIENHYQLGTQHRIATRLS
jgi:hypothetical protein